MYPPGAVRHPSPRAGRPFPSTEGQLEAGDVGGGHRPAEEQERQQLAPQEATVARAAGCGRCAGTGDGGGGHLLVGPRRQAALGGRRGRAAVVVVRRRARRDLLRRHGPRQRQPLEDLHGPRSGGRAGPDGSGAGAGVGLPVAATAVVGGGVVGGGRTGSGEVEGGAVGGGVGWTNPVGGGETGVPGGGGRAWAPAGTTAAMPRSRAAAVPGTHRDLTSPPLALAAGTGARSYPEPDKGCL